MRDTERIEQINNALFRNHQGVNIAEAIDRQTANLVTPRKWLTVSGIGAQVMGCHQFFVQEPTAYFIPMIIEERQLKSKSIQVAIEIIERGFLIDLTSSPR